MLRCRPSEITLTLADVNQAKRRLGKREVARFNNPYAAADSRSRIHRGPERSRDKAIVRSSFVSRVQHEEASDGPTHASWISMDGAFDRRISRQEQWNGREGPPETKVLSTSPGSKECGKPSASADTKSDDGGVFETSPLNNQFGFSGFGQSCQQRKGAIVTTEPPPSSRRDFYNELIRRGPPTRVPPRRPHPSFVSEQRAVRRSSLYITQAASSPEKEPQKTSQHQSDGSGASTRPSSDEASAEKLPSDLAASPDSAVSDCCNKPLNPTAPLFVPRRRGARSTKHHPADQARFDLSDDPSPDTDGSFMVRSASSQNLHVIASRQSMHPRSQPSASEHESDSVSATGRDTEEMPSNNGSLPLQNRSYDQQPSSTHSSTQFPLLSRNMSYLQSVSANQQSSFDESSSSYSLPQAQDSVSMPANLPFRPARHASPPPRYSSHSFSDIVQRSAIVPGNSANSRMQNRHHERPAHVTIPNDARRLSFGDDVELSHAAEEFLRRRSSPLDRVREYAIEQMGQLRTANYVVHPSSVVVVSPHQGPAQGVDSPPAGHDQAVAIFPPRRVGSSIPAHYHHAVGSVTRSQSEQLLSSNNRDSNSAMLGRAYAYGGHAEEDYRSSTPPPPYHPWPVQQYADYMGPYHQPQTPANSRHRQPPTPAYSAPAASMPHGSPPGPWFRQSRPRRLDSGVNAVADVGRRTNSSSAAVESRTSVSRTTSTAGGPPPSAQGGPSNRARSRPMGRLPDRTLRTILGDPARHFGQPSSDQENIETVVEELIVEEYYLQQLRSGGDDGQMDQTPPREGRLRRFLRD